jgi:hypothetical protein
VVAAVVGLVGDRDVTPGQGLELLVEGGLVGLDDQQVGGVLDVDQPVGVGVLGVSASAVMTRPARSKPSSSGWNLVIALVLASTLVWARTARLVWSIASRPAIWRRPVPRPLPRPTRWPACAVGRAGGAGRRSGRGGRAGHGIARVPAQRAGPADGQPQEWGMMSRQAGTAVRSWSWLGYPHDHREPCLFYIEPGPLTRPSPTRQARTVPRPWDDPPPRRPPGRRELADRYRDVPATPGRAPVPRRRAHRA